MKKSLLWFLKLCVAGVIAFAVLSAFVYFYNSSGVHIKNKSGATDYIWLPGQRKATMVEGFAWLSFDKNGFNNVEPNKNEDIDILLMGSSHMEAAQVAANENTAYLLNQLLPDCYTYNIGTSGHQLYHNIANLHNAIEMYHPRRYVVIETSLSALDEETMRQVLDGSFQHIVSYDTGLLYKVQKNVPLVKAMYKKVEDWWAADGNAVADDEADSGTTQLVYTDTYEDTIFAFLKMAADEAQAAGVELIIAYHGNYILSNDGIQDNTDRQGFRIFADTCEKLGITLLDMTDSATEHYIAYQELPNGFANTSVGSGHMNACGHRLFAEMIAGAIAKEDEK